MELDSVQLICSGECIDDTSAGQLLSPDSSDAYNVFGDQEVIPRVGIQYQVEIPPLMAESEYLLYKKNPFEVEFEAGLPLDFLIGLPIPVVRITYGTSNNNWLSKSHSSKATQVGSTFNDTELNVEPLKVAWENGIGSGDSTNLALEQEMEGKMHLKCRGEGYCLVPGSFGGSWSNIEEASFLLGLYIFGKNLVQVKRFIDAKMMGNILSFYYGKFYRSDEYRKWKDCRKMRSRRHVNGQRIFTRVRQQELLSRLSLHVSEECQNTLLEVSMTFGEGKMSLEEYVTTLKAIVGMKSLVEAVGIGKGKQDLTGNAYHVIPTRPEVPIGKACSSLSPIEIMKFLRGDFRLSKARSSDLFWEAVWPRLLARGWHSEQPRDKVYAADSKHSLVFLMPDVKKFSRRRLVNGIHYFDCVTDVLRKVASNPCLLELETEADESNRNKEECMRSPQTKLEHSCYLQARTPNHGSDLMKLTVVDTSLVGRKLFKVRELETLAVESSKTSTSRSRSAENDEDSSKVSSENQVSVDTMLLDRKEINDKNFTQTVSGIGKLSDEKDVEIGASNQGILIENSDYGNASKKNSKEFINNLEDEKPIKSLKCSRGLKEKKLSFLAPVTKRRRRLLPCPRPETRHGLLSSLVSPGLEQEKHGCFSESTNSGDINPYELASSRKRVSSSTNSSRGSATEGGDGIFCPCEESQSRTLIDLNLPQILPEFETVEAPTVELRNSQDDLTTKLPENSTAPKPCSDVIGNTRRQGTRNRPPTVRALEALANGFLTTSRRRKNKESFPKETSMSKPRRADGEMVANGSFGTGLCSGKSDMFSKFHVLSEGNAAQVSGP